MARFFQCFGRSAGPDFTSGARSFPDDSRRTRTKNPVYRFLKSMRGSIASVSSCTENGAVFPLSFTPRHDIAEPRVRPDGVTGLMLYRTESVPEEKRHHKKALPVPPPVPAIITNIAQDSSPPSLPCELRPDTSNEIRPLKPPRLHARQSYHQNIYNVVEQTSFVTGSRCSNGRWVVDENIRSFYEQASSEVAVFSQTGVSGPSPEISLLEKTRKEDAPTSVVNVVCPMPHPVYRNLTSMGQVLSSSNPQPLVLRLPRPGYKNLNLFGSVDHSSNPQPDVLRLPPPVYKNLMSTGRVDYGSNPQPLNLRYKNLTVMGEVNFKTNPQPQPKVIARMNGWKIDFEKIDSWNPTKRLKEIGYQLKLREKIYGISSCPNRRDQRTPRRTRAGSSYVFKRRKTSYDF